MRLPFFRPALIVLLALASVDLAAQQPRPDGPSVLSSFDSGLPADSLHLPDIDAVLLPHPPMPIMSAELALQAFANRGRRQSAEPPSYTDDTLVIAELPETAQRGAFELQRNYKAPHSLSYKPIQFTGDSFVKTNVITRVLQSEVEFVQKGDPTQVALSDANYKFSYKGLQDLNGHPVHIYQVKPRQKRVGLFRGRIYLDAHTGAVMRSEGSVDKSPSFFVRKLEFVQDYASIDQYSLPSHLHSTAKARIIGRTVVDVYHREYQFQTTSASLAAASHTVGQP